MRYVKRVLEVLVPVLLAGVVLFFIVRSWKTSRASAGAEGADGSAGEDLSAVTSITCNNGQETLEFHRDESGQWRWIDEDYPLDSSQVEELASLLSRFSPTVTVDSGESVDLEAYGLDFPSYTAAFTTAAGETTSLCFGSARDDGDYYMKYEDDDTAVYVAGSYLVDKVRRGLYDLCLPEEFPALTAENVTALTIEGSGGSAVYQTRKQGASLRWYHDGADVTGDAQFQAVLEALSSMTFTSCVVWDPAPESLKICGLKAPAVTLSVEYNDANDRACSLTLSVGNRRDEESYFASWSVSAAVYAIPQEAAAPLLAAAPQAD
ncbi:MAG: DUF4340 domain-containing protein [Oscillospiraceae bacterium]